MLKAKHGPQRERESLGIVDAEELNPLFPKGLFGCSHKSPRQPQGPGKAAFSGSGPEEGDSATIAKVQRPSQERLPEMNTSPASLGKR